MTMTDPNDVRRQFEAWFAVECPMTAELANDGDTRAVENRNFASKGYQAALQSPAVREVARLAGVVCAALNASRLIMQDKDCRDHAGDLCTQLRAALRTLGAGHVE